MFAVFAGYNYYPDGGWDDFVGMYVTFDEAVAAGHSAPGDWAHVVNINTLEKIDL
jgi:hypothetical protein